MSGVNNITLSYQEYKSYIKNNQNSRLVNRRYSMETADNAKSEQNILGSTLYTDAKTNDRYTLTAAYADSFSSDAPMIKITAQKPDGTKQEYTVNIDEVDASSASDLEMFALCSYADAHEKHTEGTKSKWALLKGYVQDNSMDEGAMQKRDWISMVDNTKESYMEAKLYKQVTDGNQLTQFLDKYGMPKEVEMRDIGEGILVPVENSTYVSDLDGGYAQIQFDSSGEIRYVNHLNEEAGWSMDVSQEQLKKARGLDSTFAMYLSDKDFWSRYLNSEISIDDLRSETDYQHIRQDFFDHLPASVRQAWDQAATASGTDGLGIDENGQFLYPSEFLRQHMLAKLNGDRLAFDEADADSVLEFARQALFTLKDARSPEYNPALQAFKNQEVLFYENLIKNLE